jgi:hypothetical protein
MPTNITSYVQGAWSDYIENISLDDVKIAIQETIQMDDEHGAFWVGIGDSEEYILKTHKDLIVIGIFEKSSEIKKQFNNLQEIENLYKILLSRNYNEVKQILQS